LFRGAVGKELLLLTRDRAFLVQTLVLPLLLGGFYFVLHWRAGTALIQDPRSAATFAFGLGAYVLGLSAFHVLAAQGGPLWLLYAFPRSVHSLLAQKPLLWCALASLYVLAVLVAAGLMGMPPGADALVAGVMAVLGVLVYAFIASALGSLAANPL